MQSSMFSRYGGFASIHKLVFEFYDRMLDSDVLGPYFEDVDMAKLVDHQTKFVSQVMGGPVTYSNEVLEQVHRRLAIDQNAFNEMSRILEETLRDGGVHEDDVAAIMAEIKSRQPYIVTAS